MRTTNTINEKKENKFSENVNANPLTLDTEVFEHIISVLTNLYSNIEYAVLREYVSNALDSHTQAGVDTPVQIYIPSSTNGHVLTIRDYGVGMSLDEINSIYRQYGASTKRKDNTQIGGFGLGGKSALALTDSFSAISVKDGVQVKFHIEKAASEVTEAEIPYLLIDEVTKTTHGNGFTVKIPFNGKAPFTVEEVEQFFIGVPTEKILINKILNTKSVYNPEMFHPVIGMDSVPVGWFTKVKPVYEKNRTIKAVVGGIVYPIDLEKLDYSDISAAENRMNSTSVHKQPRRLQMFQNDIKIYLNIPVGALKLTPSREDLSYKPQTIQALNVALQTFQEMFESKCVEMISVHSEPEKIVPECALWQKHFRNSLTWRSETIDTVHEVNSFTATYCISGKTPKSKTAYLKRVKYSMHMDTEAIQASHLFVSYPTGLSDDEIFCEAEKLRKRYGSILGIWGYRTIYLVPEIVYDNKWWNWYPAFNKEIKTVPFIMEALKAATRNGRKKTSTKVAAKPIADDSPYRVFYSPETDDARKIFGYKITKSNDEVFNKPIAYLSPDCKGISYPDLSFDKKDFSDMSGMWSFIKDNFAKDYTIVLLNRRQKLEKFLSIHPNAVNIYPMIVAKACETGVEELSYAWTTVASYLNYKTSSTLRELTRNYPNFVKETQLNSAELDDLVKYCATTGKKLTTVAALYHIVSSPLTVKSNYIAIIKKYEKLAEKYGMFNHMMNMGERSKYMDDMVKVFKSIK